MPKIKPKELHEHALFIKATVVQLIFQLPSSNKGDKEGMKVTFSANWKK